MKANVQQQPGSRQVVLRLLLLRGNALRLLYAVDQQFVGRHLNLLSVYLGRVKAGLPHPNCER